MKFPIEFRLRGERSRFSSFTFYTIAPERVGVVRALRVKSASETERSRFIWLPAFCSRVQLFIQ